MLRQAVILVGGQGTRLGVLTKQTPKPMLPVAGIPFLEYLIWNLARHGIEDIILSCGYLGEQIVAHFQNREAGGPSIRCFVEPQPLGTGGALRFLQAELQPNFFLLNGDSLFDINYLDLTLQKENSGAVIALRYVENASRYGRVETDGEQVVQFLEKMPEPQPGLINAGIYWMDRRLVERLPEGVSSLEQQLFPQLVAEGLLFGKKYDGYFIDIGIPADYQRADRDLISWKRKPAIFFDRDGVINVDHRYVHTADRFEWIPGAPQAIRWCNEHGYLVFVVTNQAGIARGYYDEAQFQTFTRWIEAELASFAAHIDAVYYCPHHPSEGVGELRTSCRCRKPNPGMLEQALAVWDVDKEGSYLIGDKSSDVEAAQQVGIRGHLFQGEAPLDEFLKNLL